MNRVSRRSAEEAAEALLEAGRSQPSLDYDVDLGLARHHDWLRKDAPVPEWASANVGIAPQSFAAVLIKTIVSSMLVGVLATAAWQARGLLQPRAAVEQASPAAQTALPNEEEALPSAVSLDLKPIPVPEQVLASEQPARSAAHADARDKRALRVQRAHKEHSSPRAASPRAEPSVARTEPARVEAVAPASTPSSGS